MVFVGRFKGRSVRQARQIPPGCTENLSSEVKSAEDGVRPVVCTENLIRVDDVLELPKLAE